MNILEVIKDRRSARAFKPDSISGKIITEILELTINAPSANNLQPWEFIIVVDKEKERLSRTLIKAYREKRLSCSSGAVKPLPEAIKQRGIQTQDSLKTYTERIGVSLYNFVNEGSCNFYGAPVAIIICLDDSFSNRQMIDVGTALGYLVLAAHDFGLATCPIGLIADYSDDIKDLLNIPENKKVIIGVALGYPDRENPMSQFRSSRADGNMTTRGSQTITWDVENRPVTVTGGASFVYDGDGHRVKKTESGQTILYINQYYEKNLTTGVVTTSYYLGGQLVAAREGTTLRYVHQDSLGSTSVMSTSSGTLDSSVAYFPYGDLRNSQGNLGTDKRFTGQRLDSTGLYYYGARYYDATIGRFISADTIVQSFSNPQTLNRYPRASSWFFTIQASLDLKLGKNNLKNEMNTSPLHSPTCKHVVLCPSGFQ